MWFSCCDFWSLNRQERHDTTNKMGRIALSHSKSPECIQKILDIKQQFGMEILYFQMVRLIQET